MKLIESIDIHLAMNSLKSFSSNIRLIEGTFSFSKYSNPCIQRQITENRSNFLENLIEYFIVLKQAF